MAERFERLYQLPANLYVSGAPIIVSAGALLRDTQTDSVIVQLKFHSVSKKTIKAVKVSIAAQDVSKQPIQGIDDYQYLDLNIKHGQEFGANKAIVLQNSVARFFAISAITVVFADESKWLWDTTQSLQPLPTSTPLHSTLTSNEMVKQYQIATNASAQYVPIDEGTIWQCSCGEWNGEHLCSKCKLSKTTAFAAFDKPQLNADMTARLVAEQAKREAEQERRRIERERKEEAERILAEKSEARRKKIKKIAIIVSIPVVIAIMLFVVVSIVNNEIIIPNNKYDDAIALMNEGKYTEAISVFEALDGYKDSLDKIAECNTAIFDSKYSDAIRLMDAGKYTEAISTFKDLNGYKDSQDKIAECNTAILDGKYSNGVALMDAGKYAEAISAFENLDGYKDATNKITECQEIIQQQNEAKLASQYDSAKQLMNQGEIAKAAIAFYNIGEYKDAKQLAKTLWDSIAERNTIAAEQHTIGLKANGTAIAVGVNTAGQCNVSDWDNIISVGAGTNYSVGLKADGTVIAVGNNYYGQCNVSGWKDIVAISATGEHTVGLKADGTVIATGKNGDGQCNVGDWTDIVAIVAADYHTVGLKADGTVVATGENDYGECNVSDWTDIIAISAGFRYTIGLKADGTVVATGDNTYGECNVSGWKNIVAISAGSGYTVGLKADGTVVAVGSNEYNQCNVSGWKNIVAIDAGGGHVVGLKADGTVIAAGSNNSNRSDVGEWRDIKLP